MSLSLLIFERRAYPSPQNWLWKQMVDSSAPGTEKALSGQLGRALRGPGFQAPRLLLSFLSSPDRASFAARYFL